MRFGSNPNGRHIVTQYHSAGRMLDAVRFSGNSAVPVFLIISRSARLAGMATRSGVRPVKPGVQC